MYEYYWDGENWLKVYKNDNKLRFYVNGKVHNKGKPYIHFFNNNKIIAEEYYLNGILHCNDGPAVINYYFNDNVIKSVIYIQNSYFHRRYGPAEIWYNNNGTIDEEEYWFKGIIFNPEELPFELPIDSEEKEFMFHLKYGE